jgi:hypothetical protein
MKLIDSTKEVFKNNKMLKFLAVGGAGAAVVDTFITLPFIGLMEMVGQGAGAMAINQAVKGNESMKEKSASQVTGHIVKSAFLTVGGLALHTAGAFLPLGHITSQITNTIVGAGAIGLVEGGIEKFNRRDKAVATEVKKESIFTAKNVEENSSAYHEMRSRNFKATEEEVEASELSFSKSFKKR